MLEVGQRVRVVSKLESLDEVAQKVFGEVCIASRTAGAIGVVYNKTTQKRLYWLVVHESLRKRAVYLPTELRPAPRV
ncbi:hypothetical protein KC887_01485 [Candidatus Kaiserbacteria bacterium]|nr:hypothetical protein [Candidatus Kaiserbacteria bacterium]